MRYPVILLDVGETLVTPRDTYGAVYGRALRELGIEVEAGRLERAIRATAVELAQSAPPGTDRFSRFEGGESGYWRRFVEHVLQAVGRTVDPRVTSELLERLWLAFGDREAWRVHDDVRPALETLRGAGVRLGVVSNWDSRLPRLLEILDLAGYFETLGVSQVEGVEKPDPTLFRRVLERLGTVPDEALHVGDVLEVDVAGATAAGVDAVLIARNGSPPPALSVIRDLRELPPLARDGLREKS